MWQAVLEANMNEERKSCFFFLYKGRSAQNIHIFDDDDYIVLIMIMIDHVFPHSIQLPSDTRYYPPPHILIMLLI